MANVYYQKGDQRADRVQDLFTVIARRYDRINDLQSLGLHRRWKRRLVRLARPEAGDSALDICCGTGDITYELARAGVAAVGLDFNASMLGVARRRRRRPFLSVPEFLQGDGQHLPFPDGSFDIATVGYGLRNLSDWERGLDEMWRVTRSGGRILVLDFGKPANSLWRAVYFAYLRIFVPILGKVVCGDSQAYAYILESLQDYPAQEGVADYFKRKQARETQTLLLLGGAMSINLGVKP